MSELKIRPNIPDQKAQRELLNETADFGGQLCLIDGEPGAGFKKKWLQLSSRPFN